MRRMRDISWRHWLLAVPAVGAALGIQYWLRTRFPTAIKEDTTAFVLKPSHFFPDSGSGLADSAALAAAKRRGLEEKKSGWQYLKPNTAPIRKAEGFTPWAIIEEGADEDLEEEDYSDEDEAIEQARVDSESGIGSAKRKPKTDQERDQERFQPKPVSLSAKKDENDSLRVPAASMPVAMAEPEIEVQAAPAEVVAAGGKCASIEYRGDGPKETKVTKAEWERTITIFNDVKGGLLEWLDQNRTGFPDATARKMEEQVREISLVKPPAMEEPDLAWRGIGVVALSSENEPIVRIGSGLVKLAVKQPSRARFELARLVAQAWAPCELQRLGAEDAWNPLLECLGVKEDDVCGAGTYSEGGWAVSSTLAAIVAKTDCTIPAFAKADAAKCVKKVPLPLMLARDQGMVRVSKVSANANASGSLWPFQAGGNE